MQGCELTTSPAHKDRSSSLFTAGHLLVAAAIPEKFKPFILKCQVEEIKINIKHNPVVR